MKIILNSVARLTDRHNMTIAEPVDRDVKAQNQTNKLNTLSMGESFQDLNFLNSELLD